MDDDRRKRRDEEQRKQRNLLYLLGFACLIQLFISFQGSREIAQRWQQTRADETRAFEKRVRDEAGLATRVTNP